MKKLKMLYVWKLRSKLAINNCFVDYFKLTDNGGWEKEYNFVLTNYKKTGTGLMIPLEYIK